MSANTENTILFNTNSSSYGIGNLSFWQEASLVFNANNKRVVEIKYDGRIFWNGREVETDDDFKKAMMDIHNALCYRRTL